MDILEKAQLLLRDPRIQSDGSDFLTDCIDAISGDPFPVAKILFRVGQSLLSLRDIIFWGKYQRFLEGVYPTEDEGRKFAAKLASDGKRQENALRLISCINRVDVIQKVDYLINASRTLSAGFIDLPTYFRICHAIESCIAEDLVFLSEHILEAEIEYSIEVQGLVNAGLMLQTVYDAGGGQQKYGFTELAHYLDRYAVSYNRVDRYVNPKEPIEFQVPKIEMKNVPAVFS